MHNIIRIPHIPLDDWYLNMADGLLTAVCSFDTVLVNVSILSIIQLSLGKWTNMAFIVIILTGSDPIY